MAKIHKQNACGQKDTPPAAVVVISCHFFFKAEYISKINEENVYFSCKTISTQGNRNLVRRKHRNIVFRFIYCIYCAGCIAKQWSVIVKMSICRWHPDPRSTSLTHILHLLLVKTQHGSTHSTVTKNSTVLAQACSGLSALHKESLVCVWMSRLRLPYRRILVA